MVEVENYRLDYLEDDLGNEDSIFINQASSRSNDLAQLADNFVLSNEDRNLLDRFETNSIYEFNLSSQKPSPRQSLLTLCHNMQPNAISKWDIPKVKQFNTKTSDFDIIRHKIKNTFGFQPYKWKAAVILDILNRFDVTVQAATSLGKSLLFQATFRIKIGAIILVISPTMALIED